MRGETTTTPVSEQASLPVRCAHDPDPETAYRSDGLKAHLQLDVDVPVEALCRSCGKWIRREQRSVTGPGAVWHLKYPNEDPPCAG